jgi:hypothetical protein
MTTTTTISVAEMMTLVQGMATLNLGYLVLCVTIILFAGGFFYLFNFRPLQESIEKQDGQLESLKKDVETKIENINIGFKTLISSQTAELALAIDRTTKEVEYIKKEATEKVENGEKKFLAFTERAERELKDLKTAHQISELNRMWQEHYMWDGRGVHENTLTILLTFMENRFEYALDIITDGLWLSRVEKVLGKVEYYKSDDKLSIHARLLSLFDKIQGHEIEKSKIKKIVEKVFE